MRILASVLLLLSLSTHAQTGFITTSNPGCYIHDGSNTCVSEISWYSDTPSMCVRVKGSPPKLWSCTKGGKKTENWPFTTTSALTLELVTGSGTDAEILDEVVVVAERSIQFCTTQTIGVNYHSYTDNFDTGAFINQYHIPHVRHAVLDQLQEMADLGVEEIETALWINTLETLDKNGKDNLGRTWRTSFPPSEIQLSNLAEYVQDAASITNMEGRQFDFTLNLGWGWDADHSYFETGGCVYEGWRGNTNCEIDNTTLFGASGISVNEYNNRVTQTYTSIIDAVKNIKNTNGDSFVQSIGFMNEARFGHRITKGRDWFLLQHYTDFSRKVRGGGAIPTLDFHPGGMESNIFDDDFVDTHNSILNGHRSAYWVYRSIKFMVDNDLVVPDIIEFSFYPEPVVTTKEALVSRLIDDLNATLPALGLQEPLRFKFVESFNYQSESLSGQRKQFGDAIKKQPQIQGVNLWSCPYNRPNSFSVPVSHPYTLMGIR